MKKIMTLVLVLSMLLALTLPMTSCSTAARLSRMEETKRAYYFYAVTDRNMSYASSGMFDKKMTLDATINGVAYKQTSESTVTFVSDRNSLNLLEKAKTTVDTVGGGTVIYTDTGYLDGMIFLHTKEGGNETSLKSAVSLEDYGAYNQYMNGKSPAIDVSADSVKTVTCKMNDDETWTATYEDFTPAGLVPFLYMLWGIDYYVTAEYEIVDVRMTVNADAKLYPTNTKIEFIFSENPEATSDAPVIVLENTYRGWDNVTMESYDISSFTEVDDLRALNIFLDALLEKGYEDSGIMETTMTSTARGIGYNSTETNKQRLTFNNTNGFAFDLSYDKDGYKYKMAYDDGDLSVRIYDAKSDRLVDSSTEAMPEADARATVAQLIDPEGLTIRSISDVEVLNSEEGTCKFTLSDAVKNAYKEQYEAMGLSMKSFEGYCLVTMKDGVLTEYCIHVEMTLWMSGSSFQSTVDMIITFPTAEQGAESV